METEKDLLMFYQTSLRNVGLYTSVSLALLGYSRFYRGKNKIYNIVFILLSLAVLLCAIAICKYLVADLTKMQENVDTIVKMFRFYMSPSFEGGLQSRHMIVPATFDITYMTNNGRVNEYLNRVSTCVLKSANVTYGGERVQFFRPNEKGAPPVETNIELQFQEIDLITREKLALGF